MAMSFNLGELRYLAKHLEENRSTNVADAFLHARITRRVQFEIHWSEEAEKYEAEHDPENWLRT